MLNKIIESNVVINLSVIICSLICFNAKLLSQNIKPTIKMLVRQYLINNDTLKNDKKFASYNYMESPSGVAINKFGDVFIADDSTSTICKVDRHGKITAIAGKRVCGFGGDGGSATNALLNKPSKLAFDELGNLYILDKGNGRIRRIDSKGIISTIAGGGKIEVTNQIICKAKLVNLGGEVKIKGMSVDKTGNIFLLIDIFNPFIKLTNGKAGEELSEVFSYTGIFKINVINGNLYPVFKNSQKRILEKNYQHLIHKSFGFIDSVEFANSCIDDRNNFYVETISSNREIIYKISPNGNFTQFFSHYYEEVDESLIDKMDIRPTEWGIQCIKEMNGKLFLIGLGDKNTGVITIDKNGKLDWPLVKSENIGNHRMIKGRNFRQGLERYKNHKIYNKNEADLSIENPTDFAIDKVGNLVILESESHEVLKVVLKK